jgi:hypothetical protein
MRHLTPFIFAVLTVPIFNSRAEYPRVADFPGADLGRLLELIKPQPDESPWWGIPWLTDITEARRRSIAEDKPIVIFTAADGSPQGRT